jgi:pyridoxal/pyridoxine/pyridoxamine kinase
VGVEGVEGGRRGPLFPTGKTSEGVARFGVRVPRLKASFTGTGDLTAALLLANSVKFPGSFAVALERSAAAVFAACDRTLHGMVRGEVRVGEGKAGRVAATELMVVESAGDMVNPKVLPSMSAFPL